MCKKIFYLFNFIYIYQLIFWQHYVAQSVLSGRGLCTLSDGNPLVILTLCQFTVLHFVGFRRGAQAVPRVVKWLEIHVYYYYYYYFFFFFFCNLLGLLRLFTRTVNWLSIWLWPFFFCCFLYFLLLLFLLFLFLLLLLGFCFLITQQKKGQVINAIYHYTLSQCCCCCCCWLLFFLAFGWVGIIGYVTGLEKQTIEKK